MKMDKSLDLETVRAFLAVVRHGSFSAAAHAIGRTQAAVSQQMQRLEDGLGERLMERTTRRMELTLAGARFLPYAEQLLEADRAARAAATGVAARVETMRVGAPDEIMALLLIPAVKRLRDASPDASFRLRSGPTRRLLDLLGKELDAVCGLSLHDADGGTLIARTPLVWIGTARAEPSVPLVVYPDGCLMRTQAISALDRAGLPWHVAVEVGSAGAAAAAAEAGLGIGILPAACLARRSGSDAALPDLPAIAIRLWHAGEARPPYSERLAAELARACR